MKMDLSNCLEWEIPFGLNGLRKYDKYAGRPSFHGINVSTFQILTHLAYRANAEQV